MRGRPAFMPAVNRSEIGVRARRDRYPQNLPKNFNLNINQYQSGRLTCVPFC
ncbi:hypothetical protein V1294_000214 [Bradyrhizobium sp. AZCC 1678]